MVRIYLVVSLIRSVLFGGFETVNVSEHRQPTERNRVRVIEFSTGNSTTAVASSASRWLLSEKSSYMSGKLAEYAFKEYIFISTARCINWRVA